MGICQKITDNVRKFIKEWTIEEKINKLLLLTWKNWLLAIRNPILAVLLIIVQAIIPFLICLNSTKTCPIHREAISYNPFSVNINKLPVNKIFWSPCGNPHISTIMKNLSKKYNKTEKCYKNKNKIEAALEYENSSVAGIQFDDSLANRKNLHKKLQVTIRLGKKYTWQTEELFPDAVTGGPREPDKEHGAEPYYFQAGFLTLQHDISDQIINSYVKEPLPTIKMRRFPYPSWTCYDILIAAKDKHPHYLIMCGYIFPFAYRVRDIVEEKEKLLKELLKITGLSIWLYWLSWFVKIFVTLVVSIMALSLLLNIPWYPGKNCPLLPLTDISLFVVFILLYTCATIMFAFAISSFFTQPMVASMMGSIIFFGSYFVHWIHAKRVLVRMGFCLFHNSAMAYGYRLIETHESIGKCLGWHNMFQPVSPYNALTMGLVMIMLLVDCAVYFLIALYVEAVFPGRYGTPRVWYFPFTRKFWSRKPTDTTQDDLQPYIVEHDVSEPDPVNTEAGIKIINLTKQFKKKVAVHNLSFNMYKGQITALLGHNGAGKTTAMCVLVGVYAPTSGTAIINDCDIRTNLKGARQSLGVCLQNDVLFDRLTVSEHMYFFCRLKGLKKAQAKAETEEYIKALDLEPKKKTMSKNLSGGMKRRLCIGIGLCGQSKVCIFDEPTSGIDPATRRKLWAVLQSQKKDRTILLSTHSMEEADILSDRIAIMANGQLQCCGTSFFLKKKYGVGYRLVIVKSDRCNVVAITKLLNRYITKNVQINSNVGSELTYILPDENSDVFEEMLSNLEKNQNELGINSYGISLASMEEVFLKTGIPEEEKHAIDSDISSFHKAKSDEKERYAKGTELFVNHILAGFMMRMLLTLRSWTVALIHLLICLVCIALLVLSSSDKIDKDFSPLTISLNTYWYPITTVTTDNLNNTYYNKYLDIVKSDESDIYDWHTDNMEDHLLETTMDSTDIVRTQYIIGATFYESNNTILAWFNNQPFHSPPLALQYVINSIVKVKLGSEYSIEFINHPSPHNMDGQIALLHRAYKKFLDADIILSFAMMYLACYFITFYISERVTKAKHLQFVSGVNVIAYLLTTFLWDFLFYLGITVCMIVMIVFFAPILKAGVTFSLFVAFGIEFLPMVYISSLFFQSASNAYNIFGSIFLGMGLVPFILMLLGLSIYPDSEFLKGLHIFLMIIPVYAFVSAIDILQKIKVEQKTCSDINKLHNLMGNGSQNNTSIKNFACKNYPDVCCDLENIYYKYDKGIGKHIIVLSIGAIVLFVIIILYEYRIMGRLVYLFSWSRQPKLEDTDDADVLEEKQKVREGSVDYKDKSILLNNLTKYYKGVPVVNQICLALGEYECFGLLGVNGAGKTTTFRMITGDIKIDFGDVWLNGSNLKKSSRTMYKNFGYCPQYDALFEELTVRETLVIYCLFRGIPMKDCKHVIENLARDFDLLLHTKQMVKNLSGGNKRKLSVAIAILGDAKVIFLDEPSTGMDPTAKRFLWKNLCKAREGGRCLILVTHNMEECEAICTRITIMVNGTFRCLGSSQHLKSKFANGYILIIKLKNDGKQVHVDNFVRKNFANVIPQDSHPGLLTYFIKDVKMRWSKIFGVMEKSKRNISDIEDYSIGQLTLEQIFLLFTLLQKDAHEMKEKEKYKKHQERRERRVEGNGRRNNRSTREEI